MFRSKDRGKAPVVDITIKIEGVRAERLPRLKTVLKTHLLQFGRKISLEVDGKSVRIGPEPKKGK